MNDFKLNNTAGGTINTGARLTVNNVLQITSGTLVTNGSNSLHRDL